jgi:cell wall-associated NlpC family hydrolase
MLYTTERRKLLPELLPLNTLTPKCDHVEFGKHEPGDLVFFNDGGSIHHVAIICGPHTQIHAPHTGDHVREAPIMTTGRMALVQKCF